MTNQRIVSFSYFILFILLSYIGGEFFSWLWLVAGLPDKLLIGRYGIPWALSIVLSAGCWLYVARHEQVNTFLLEVVGELRNVTWPTSQEVMSHTKVVIITVLVVATILGAFDLVWSKVSKFLLNPSL